MNERIKELAEQATCFKEGLTEGLYDIEIFDKEKFAELIVRECADVAGRDVGHFVLKHFGVEE